MVKEGNFRSNDSEKSCFRAFVEKMNLEKYAGFSDWRLPSKEELGTLVAYWEKNQSPGTIGKFLNERGFHNVQEWEEYPYSLYWSSSSPVDVTSEALIVDMSHGGGGSDGKSNSHYVWPVRAGQ